MVTNPDNLERLRRYVASVEWRYASTFADFAPHWYTLRKDKPELDGEFVFFLMMVKHYGQWREWRNSGRRYQYLEFDGFKYWAIGVSMDATELINREPLQEAP